jgi:hypothetical protein
MNSARIGLLLDLKHRKVLKIVVACVATAWLALQSVFILRG